MGGHDIVDKDNISIRAKIGKISRRLSADAIIKKSWEQKTFMNNIKKADTTLNEEEMSKFRNFLDLCKSAKVYAIYKKAFTSLCRLLKIGDTNVIYTISTKSKDDKQVVSVKHAPARVSVTIPNGSILYHKSSASDIKELKPSFRDKNGIHLYSTPRIYFSILKSTGRAITGIRGGKMHVYVIQEGIKKAYVDPLIPMFSLGCLYVDRNTPIKVKKLEENEADGVAKESAEDGEIEEFTTLQEFADYYGLTIDSTEYFEESVSQKIGSAVDAIKTAKEIKKEWLHKQASFSRKVLEKEFSGKDVKKLKQCWDTMISDKVSYSTYTKAYGEFCSMCGIPKEGCIERCDMSSKDDKLSIKLRYSSGKEAIVVPNGFELVHCSPASGITELEPTFRSKTKGRYLYTKKRVYFTIERKKDIDPTKAGLEGVSSLYRYRPKEKLRCVYIDPACPNYKIGAVYVDTDFPIPVENITK